MLDFELPPGWLPHPDAPGWFYKGDLVKSEAHVRTVAANKAAHRAGQAAKAAASGKLPLDKITSSQHPAAGDKADPQLMALMKAAQDAAAEALPALFAAQAAEVLNPPHAPTHGHLTSHQIKAAKPEHALRALAQGISASCILQLAVIGHDPLQLGATRVSALAHLLERAHGKPSNMMSPLEADLASMTPREAGAAILRAAQSGGISLEELKVLGQIIERRASSAESQELLDRMAEIEALLNGSRTI
mgnify:CR=1 FL=1